MTAGFLVDVTIGEQGIEGRLGVGVGLYLHLHLQHLLLHVVELRHLLIDGLLLDLGLELLGLDLSRGPSALGPDLQ